MLLGLGSEATVTPARLFGAGPRVWICVAKAEKLLQIGGVSWQHFCQDLDKDA